MLPDFNDHGHLPPGRYRLTITQAAEAFVHAERFQASTSRAQIWQGFQEYLYQFIHLEEQFAPLLQGRELIHSVWLGGSFVSAKLDPHNVDATLLMNPEAERAIRGNPGSKWLTTAFKSWKAMQDRYGVAPLRIPYVPVAKVFQPQDFAAEELEYFRDRGRWDDWWQRCRRPGEGEPSVQSAAPVRGYVEVTL
ncbi:hypothetical protein BOQ63_015145 [Streptomyces viridifaciens]|nr:hypothetical protein CP971_08265 [Streptomyces viridifaciens]UKZ05353.1 hypothetical protein BOQ63_015145 [Streptomyces viridifaciens]